MQIPIAVVGSGYMGGGIAQTLALAGHPVAIADADPGAAARARERLLREAERYEEDGLLDAGSASTIASGLRAAASTEDAVADVELVTEAVPEDVDLKRRVLSAVGAAASPSCVVATNTSAIPLQALRTALRQPLIATHWFNPAPFLPLVEVAGVDEHALALAERVLRAAGKTPVRVPDVPGFLGNRLQFALYREAAAIVEEGLATAADVDLVVTSSFGRRLPFLGPFAVGDVAGLDVYAASFAALQDHYGERFSAPPSLTARVGAGDLGLKGGGGFRGVDPAHREALAAYRDRAYVGLERLRRSLGDPPGLSPSHPSHPAPRAERSSR